MTTTITKKFRRGERVSRTDHKGKTILGTVLNPALMSGWRNTQHLVSVRWDHQHPWENGWQHREDELTSDTSGETQFDTRYYDLHLDHYQVAALRTVLSDASAGKNGVSYDMIESLLRQLPELPE